MARNRNSGVIGMRKAAFGLPFLGADLQTAMLYGRGLCGNICIAARVYPFRGAEIIRSFYFEDNKYGCWD